MLIKKLNVIAIILLIVFGGFLGIFNFESELVCAVGNTFYVGGSGLGNYSSIQAAIDDASSGDSIFVYDGVYYGNIVINKTLNLIGQNRDTTIINGDGAEKVIKIIADEVILKGFTITNGGYGIYSWDGSYNMIYNNNISNNWYGLDLKQFSRSEIIANKISMNTYYGIYIDGYSDHNTIEANNISENQYGIFFDVTPSFNTIKRNNVITNYYGITFTRSSNNKIAFNNISSNEKHGIKISASSNNEIMYNNISLNNYGIYLDHSFNNEIKYNDISYNNEYGIRAQYSSINITGNEILMNNYIGLRFDYSIYNNVTGNNFVNGGIYMRGGKLSHYNTHNINLNNKVNGQPLHYYNDSNNINIDGLSVGQLIIVNCNEGTVENLEINNTSVAIIIAYSSKINIKNNILTNNGYGIKLDY
ncbi:MAG: right-handed parallel beta-helix repeat-containing protein, partial [Thermoplasmata archaeon]|nr:right-handed parallel beta-helix repeat-containing protein [Thermoplasmata archaeon]